MTTDSPLQQQGRQTLWERRPPLLAHSRDAPPSFTAIALTSAQTAINGAPATGQRQRDTQGQQNIASTSSRADGVSGPSAHNDKDLPRALVWLNSKSKWVASAGFLSAVLRSHDSEAGWSAAGVVAVSYLAKGLKWWLRRPRPEGSRRKDPGMPSNHATGIAYCAVVALMECVEHLAHNRHTQQRHTQPASSDPATASTADKHTSTSKTIAAATSTQGGKQQSSTAGASHAAAPGSGSHSSGLSQSVSAPMNTTADATVTRDDLVWVAMTGLVLAASLVSCWLRVACGHHTPGQVAAGAALGGGAAAVWREGGRRIAVPYLARHPRARSAMWVVVVGSFVRFFAMGVRKAARKRRAKQAAVCGA